MVGFVADVDTLRPFRRCATDPRPSAGWRILHHSRLSIFRYVRWRIFDHGLWRVSRPQTVFWLRVLLRRSISGAGDTDRVSSKTRKYRNALGPEFRIPGRDGKLSNSYRGSFGRDGKFRMMENAADEPDLRETGSSAGSSSDKGLFTLRNMLLMSLMTLFPYK